MDWTWIDILIHILLLPIYQIVGTLKHEGAHAIAAKLSGFEIMSFKFLPHRYNGSFYWGRVTWKPKALFTKPNTHMFLAPYYVDIVCIVAASAVIWNVDWESFFWFAFTVIMLGFSPIVDTAYNVLKWKLKGTGDWARAMNL